MPKKRLVSVRLSALTRWCVSIPPDREQAVVLTARSECPIDLVLTLIDDDLSRPVLVFGDPGELLCLRTGGGEDVERVGIPEIVRQVAELDQARHEEGTRLGIVGNARPIEQRGQPQLAMFHEAGMDALSIQRIPAAPAQQF